MLVYVNQLEFLGKDSFTTVFRSIAGWLKGQTNHHFTVDELISGEEFSFGGQKVRTYKADSRDPRLYAVLFSNPDSSVKGRQWITEIGVRVEEESIFFTLLLETSDISTRVTEVPITTKPKLIQYLKDNGQLKPNTVGVKVRKLENSTESLRAFNADIERKERNTPIILLSHEFDGRCTVNPNTLQGHLLGLAQVVVADENMDSWLMERELGKRYSAWGGAINVIYPSHGRDYCQNKLYLKNELEDLTLDNININLDILSRVTHFSNGYRKRQHFSPQDVRAKRASDHRKYLQEKFKDAETQESQFALLNEAFQQIEEHDRVLEELKAKHQHELDELQDEALDALATIEEKDTEIWQLKSRIDSQAHNESTGSAPSYTIELLDVVRNPTPEKCLMALEANCADRIVILDSAWKSSRKSESFQSSQKLADLLHRLSTNYYDLISTRPDAEAKRAFGNNEYSAKESETVRGNSELLKKRTFVYKGEKVSMLRHLRIGVANNVQETIRVHFHWDSENKKIVIGYCGPHLPL